MIKKPLCFVLAAIMTLAMGMTSQAADTKITSMKITFSYESGSEPKSGDSIGGITAKTDSSQFDIDSVYYVNNNETWIVGDRPVVRVDLTARDGYRFSSTSSSKFSLSGCSATYKSAKAYDDGSTLELEVYLKRIGGKLSDVDNLEWSGNIAVWDPMDGAKSYNVRLYRDDKSVATVETTGTSYDFSGYINREGSYTFAVQAISSYNNRAGEWSDKSSDNYVDEEDAWKVSGSGRWVQDQTGWWYSYNAGGYPANCWKLINNYWYYFNRSGYMVTGWQKVDGYWYYMNNDGVMLTGWQFINGQWYCMDGSGVMYANTRTPDGFYVNGSGVWVQ